MLKFSLHLQGNQYCITNESVYTYAILSFFGYNNELYKQVGAKATKFVLYNQPGSM